MYHNIVTLACAAAAVAAVGMDTDADVAATDWGRVSVA